LEGTLSFREDEDDFMMMLPLGDCAFCDGSLVDVGKGGSLVEGGEFFDGSLVEVGESELGVFDSLEAAYTFREDDALKEALWLSRTQSFLIQMRVVGGVLEDACQDETVENKVGR